VHDWQHKPGASSQQHRGHLAHVAAAERMEPAAAAAAATAAAAAAVVAAAAVQSEHAAAAAAAVVATVAAVVVAAVAVMHTELVVDAGSESLDDTRSCFRGGALPLLETQHTQWRDTGGC
jgi:hypothetical protein